MISYLKQSELKEESFNRNSLLGFVYIVACFLISLVLILGCDSSVPLDGENPFISNYEIVIPSRISVNQPVPIVVYAKDQNPRLSIWETFYLSSTDGSISPDEIVLKRGRGSITVNIIGTDDFNIELRNGSGVLHETASVQIESTPQYTEMSGNLNGDDLFWDSTSVIRLVSDTYVPAGTVLSVGPGTRIESGYHVRLIAEGEINCQGTKNEPVLFTSILPEEPWGEIDHYGAGDYTYTFFIYGGGDETQAFGHSNSQPVVRGRYTDIQLDHAYFLDNPGKALGMKQCILNMNSCLISRCDTGGELKYTQSDIEDCYFIDIPDGDGIEEDDDNDGLYVFDIANSGEPNTLYNCVFVTGEDDGIDHNQSNLVVDGCIIEKFFHEGIAASADNSVEVYNTLIIGCEQGIEAGYGEPQVIVDHCTLIGNEIGIRFGDSYDWGCNGTMNITNTISVGSLEHNVWNYDNLIGGPREGAVTTSYSIVNELQYNAGEGCLTGDPVFTNDFLLEQESIGINGGSDGLDIGILP